jgi:hypothetical protein
VADSPGRSRNGGRTGPGAGGPGRAEHESASGPGHTDTGKRERPDTGPVGGQATGSVMTPDAGSPAAPEGAPPDALLVVLRGIGAWMFLTDQHLIVARDGADWRPRTGFRAYSLDSIRHIRIELGSAPSGRIAAWTTGAEEVISMFFDVRSLDRAHELLDVARPLIARSWRGRSGTEREPDDWAPVSSGSAPIGRGRR